MFLPIDAASGVARTSPMLGHSNRRRPRIVAAASICGTCVHIISDNGQQASTRAVCVV